MVKQQIDTVETNIVVVNHGFNILKIKLQNYTRAEKCIITNSKKNIKKERLSTIC